MSKQTTIKVLDRARNNLLIDYKFLTKAIFTLDFINYPFYIGTDGQYFYYDERKLLERYLYDRDYPTKAFFHSVMHCVLKHPFIFDGNNEIYNLACDIVVESIIIEIERTKRSYKANKNKNEIIETIKEKVEAFVPIQIANYLKTVDEGKIKSYNSFFVVDDHTFWNSDFGSDNQLANSENEKNDNNENTNNSNYQYNGNNEENKPNLKDNKSRNELSERWQNISEELNMDLETFSHMQGLLAGDLVSNLSNLERQEEDYASFLKQFAVMGEVMKSNPDEFDIIYYTYGLNLYGNIALIEPLEYRDEKRIKDFVIALDTSGSVYGPLVESFLQKTYNILMNEESFHTKINIHIIQCDAAIQKVDIITNKKEIDEYIQNLSLYGFGGTDFRPVFTYVNQKIKEKEFNNLEGIIYFTDGFGTFPAYRPEYKSAFIFMEGAFIPEVPPWAIKHVIKRNELEYGVLL